MNRYFVTAIGTDSGKTLFSAILTEALKADYWKPVQSGEPADSDTIRQLLINDKSQVLKERYFLETPASPHAAAAIDGVEINLNDFELPTSESPLVVEGAGGLLVPLNNQDTMADLIKKMALPVILVSNLYLGNINHTLLSYQYLKNANIPVYGIVFKCPTNPASEEVILKMSGLKLLLKIEQENEINHSVISKYAAILNENLLKLQN